MKNIYKIFLGFILAAPLAGCAGFLDQPTLGKENLDTYFQTEEECLKHLNGCYNALTFYDWWQIESKLVAFDMASDDLWMGNTTQESSWQTISHYGNPKAADGLKEFWQYRYMGILRCNIVISRVAESPIKDETMRARIIAEAKFLRAYYYFELVKNFGGVHIVEGLRMPSEVAGITRASTSATYAFIENDLRDAIKVLPQKSEYSASDMGRATRGGALGIMGKVLLYQEKFQNASDTLSLVITEGQYDLQPQFKDVWTIATNNGIESLFEVQTTSDKAYVNGTRLPVYTGSRNDSGWSWGLPTSDLENAFIAAGDTERLMWTIVKHGDNVAGDDHANAQNYQIKPEEHKSARINRKFYIPVAQRPETYDSNHNNLNIRLLRYADVLLMYAEACYETGDETEARWALKKVRDRVSLPEVTSTGTALRDAIRAERRLELACEFNRLYDTRRWTDDNGKKAICNIMGQNGSFVRYNTQTSTDQYENTNMGARQDKGKTFREDSALVVPIPNKDSEKMGRYITFS